jgi:hypothetical protein
MVIRSDEYYRWLCEQRSLSVPPGDARCEYLLDDMMLTSSSKDAASDEVAEALMERAQFAAA